MHTGFAQTGRGERMRRLIDADALLEDIGEEPMNWTNSPEEIQEYCDWKQTVAIINSAPTIDAVEVVRCKDCRYGHATQMLGETCWHCGLTGYFEMEDGYCNKGDKRNAEID